MSRWNVSHSWVIMAVMLLAVYACGGREGRHVSIVPSGPAFARAGAAPVAGAASADAVQVDATDSGDAASFRLLEDARSPVGSPVIYSTTGGPVPDVQRAGSVQIGANVIPLPDWKRHTRWKLINGVSPSLGSTWRGASAERVAEYLLPHIDDIWESQGYENEPVADIPGLASFATRPTLRLAQGTSAELTMLALHAVSIVNTVLPWGKRIVIGSEARPLQAVEDVPDGEIFIDFVEPSKWKFLDGYEPVSSAVAPLDTVTEYDELSARWEIKGIRAGRVWMDSNAYDSDVGFMRTLVHEILHVLGLRGHSLVVEFPESIMRQSWQTTKEMDNHIPDIDADGLLAIYTRLDPGTEPEEFSAASLGAWDHWALHMHGDLDIPGTAAFGVEYRNELARPWASGPEPWAALSEARHLLAGLSGNATWTGALVGFVPEGNSVHGQSKLDVDLEDLSGQAQFTELEMDPWPKWRDNGEERRMLMWGDGDLSYTIAVQGNVFRETGGDDGIVTGSFVGRSHEGAVGTLEREDLSAAFGATR